MQPDSLAEAGPGAALASGAGEALIARLRARLAAGEVLPAERTLAEELGVKRHRLRAALGQLREGGELAAARPGRRPRRSVQDDLARGTNPVEVVELRLVLEPALARLAALRASPVEVARIERAAETAAGSAAGAADLGFHLAVAAGARNGLAAEVYAQLRRIGRDARLNLPGTGQACPTRVRQRDAEHRAVAEAIAARDPEAAEAAMRAHLLAVQRRVMERLSPGLTGG
jgi:DNA-binding FadR family transcriptional regulator